MGEKSGAGDTNVVRNTKYEFPCIDNGLSMLTYVTLGLNSASSQKKKIFVSHVLRNTNATVLNKATFRINTMP